MGCQVSTSTFESGDVVVVTGAAQGIGRAIALRLAGMGARLALWDTQREGVAETAALCRRAGTEAHSYQVDVSNWSDVEAAAGETKNAFDAPFALINNAGIFPRAAILECDPAVWERVLRVNLIGDFLCVRALCPSMVAKGRGAVVNIASSKAGIVSFTKSLALEVAGANIRANCIVPGLTETAQPLEDMTLEELHGLGRTIPLGRVGQPEDVAGVVAFLLGTDAAFITGQVIAVNGGAIMIP